MVTLRRIINFPPARPNTLIETEKNLPASKLIVPASLRLKQPI